MLESASGGKTCPKRTQCNAELGTLSIGERTHLHKSVGVPMQSHRRIWLQLLTIYCTEDTDVVVVSCCRADNPCVGIDGFQKLPDYEWDGLYTLNFLCIIITACYNLQCQLRTDYLPLVPAASPVLDASVRPLYNSPAIFYLVKPDSTFAKISHQHVSRLT